MIDFCAKHSAWHTCSVHCTIDINGHLAPASLLAPVESLPIRGELFSEYDAKIYIVMPYMCSVIVYLTKHSTQHMCSAHFKTQQWSMVITLLLPTTHL